MSSVCTASDFVFCLEPDLSEDRVCARETWSPEKPTYRVFITNLEYGEQHHCLSDQPDERPAQFMPKEWRACQEETNMWTVDFLGSEMELIEQLAAIGFRSNAQFDQFLGGLSPRSEEFIAYQQNKRLTTAVSNTTAPSRFAKI